MARKSLMMKKMAASKPVVESVFGSIQYEIEAMQLLSWHDFRAYAKEKGVPVFGRGRAVIERDLVEVLRG